MSGRGGLAPRPPGSVPAWYLDFGKVMAIARFDVIPIFVDAKPIIADNTTF